MKNRVTRVVTVLCGLVMGMGGTLVNQVTPAQAGPSDKPNMYAVFQGIRDDSTAVPQDAIVLSSLQFGMGNSVGVGVGVGSKGMSVGKPKLSDIVFTKMVDLSSPAIMEAVATGRIVTGDIYLQKYVHGRQVTYLHLQLEGMFTGESESTGSGEEVSESVSFTPITFDYTYTSYQSDGTAGATLHFKWDAKTARASLSTK